MYMRKESGEIKSDREEILKTCADFYESPYAQTEVPEFTEEEVERAIKRKKRHKTQRMEGTTSYNIKPGGGGQIFLTYLTNIFSNKLKTKQIPDSRHEAKIVPVILFKNGHPKDIKNYRPISLLSHSYKMFTRLS